MWCYMMGHYLDDARAERQRISAEIQAANKKAACERTKAWRAANPDKAKAIAAKYQAKKRANIADMQAELAALRELLGVK